MTAEKLQAIAHDLRAWADAIDPSEPPSVVTDEMVGAVLRAAFGSAFGDWTEPRAILEAAERLGWTPPGEAGGDFLANGSVNDIGAIRVVPGVWLAVAATTNGEIAIHKFGFTANHATNRVVATYHSLYGKGDR